MDQDNFDAAESASSCTVDMEGQMEDAESSIGIGLEESSVINTELSCHDLSNVSINSGHVAENGGIAHSNPVLGNVSSITTNPSIINVSGTTNSDNNKVSNPSTVLSLGSNSSFFNLNATSSSRPFINLGANSTHSLAQEELGYDEIDLTGEDANVDAAVDAAVDIDIDTEGTEEGEGEGEGEGESEEDDTTVVDREIQELETGNFSLAEHKATDDCCGGGGCGCGCGVCKGRNVYASCGFNTFLKIFVKQNCKLKRNEAKKRAKAIYLCMCDAEREAYRRIGCCKKRIKVNVPCHTPPCSPTPCPMPSCEPPCDPCYYTRAPRDAEVDTESTSAGEEIIELTDDSGNHEGDEANC